MVRKPGCEDGASKRKRQSDPFDELCQHVDRLASASAKQERDNRREDLATFVEGMSSRERKRVRSVWWKSPFNVHEALGRALARELNGSFGPAATLLGEIVEDRKARLASLPDPPPDGGERTAEEWTAIFMRDGWPEDKAKEAAATLSRTAEELTRDFYIANGVPPEVAESMTAEARRNRNWSAAADAVTPTVLTQQERERTDGLRNACPAIAKAADVVARGLAALVLAPSRAVELRDETLTGLFLAIDAAIFAGQPDAPVVNLTNTRMRLTIRRPKDAFIWSWHDNAMSAGEVADAIANGEPPHANQIAEIARSVANIAKEARAHSVELERTRGRPQKAALDAAEVLTAQGLSWSQIAWVLHARKLWVEPHTAENIRKSVLRRRRRRATAPPATK
jgi:hypothetical protein